MKKLICLTLVILALFGCLAACNFTQNTSGDFAGEAASAPKVEEMMTALAENRTDYAKALMHPNAAEKSDAAIKQMAAYLSGRKADAIERISINVNTATAWEAKPDRSR